MLWMKCLVFSVVLMDVCVAQSPIIWYPFEVSSYAGKSMGHYDCKQDVVNDYPESNCQGIGNSWEWAPAQHYEQHSFTGYLSNKGTLGVSYDLQTKNHMPRLTNNTVDGGTALHYNNSGALQSLGTLNLNVPLTISMWVKLGSVQFGGYSNIGHVMLSGSNTMYNGGTVFTIQNSDNPAVYNYQTYQWSGIDDSTNDGGVKFTMWDKGIILIVNKEEVINTIGAGNQIQYALNQWMHITIVIEYTSQVRTKLYIDDVLMFTVNGAPGNTISPSNLQRIRIGKFTDRLTYGNYPNIAFSGSIDDFRVYNYVLSGSQITALMTQQIQTCRPGLTKVGGTCTSCAASTFKPFSGDFACVQCEAGSYSSVGSTSCTCSTGYERDVRLIGEIQAVNCNLEYGPIYGCQWFFGIDYDKTGIFTCQACPNSLCKCDEGYTGPAGSCTACNVGQYKDSMGSEVCTTCNAGYTSNIASVSNLNCVPLMCAAGSTAISGVCTNCVVGKYKTDFGSGACTDCSTSKYSDTQGAISCLNCPSNANSPSSSSAIASCTCNTGYTGVNGGVCSECVAGKYKMTTGSDACVNCVPGKYQTNNGMSFCVACAIGTYSAAGVDQCTSCAPGYSNDLGSQTNASQCYFCDIPPPGLCKPALSFSFESFYIDPNAYSASYGVHWFPNKGYLGSKFDLRFQFHNGYGYIAPELSAGVIGMSFKNRGALTNPDITALADWSIISAPMAFSLYFQRSTETSEEYNLMTLGGYNWDMEVVRIYGNSACIKSAIGPTDGIGEGYNKGVYNERVVTVSYCWEDYGLSSGPKIPFTVGVWYNVLITVENNQNNFGVISLYIDGAFKGTATSTFTIDFTLEQKRRFSIGRKASIMGAGNTFNGNIDEVSVFTGSLTSYVIGENTRKSCDVRTYWNASSMECVPCADGYYKSEFSVALCTACPAGTWTLAGGGGAQYMSDCQRCSAGYTGADSVSGLATCTACVAGKYKSAPGSGSCTSCPSYSTSVSGTGSISGCTCVPGYSGPGGGPCAPCPSGTYKNVTGSGACTTCGDDGSGPLGSTAFANCVFACAPGKTGPDGSCSACVAGKYKTTSGSVACTGCGVGTYSTTVGASAVSTCVSCPVNSNSVASSSAITGCTCNAGYTGPDGGVCSACVAGKYKTSGGSAVCMDCGVGMYSLAVGATTSATCVSCVSNSNSAVSSSAIAACICNAGFTGPDGGVCSACVAGKYKTSSGSAACTDCGMTTYSVTVGASASSTCVACPATTNAPSSSSDVAACACNVGYTGANGGTCTACVAGKYKTVSGSASCSDCSAGTYLSTTGATAAGTCSACAANSYSVALGASTSTTCTCNPGYTGPDGVVCSACLAGSFKTQTGSAACELCPNNTFSVDIGRSSSCVPCQANAVSASGSASQTFCYCKIGYAHVAGMSTCKICDPGTWNSQLGRTACSNCSVGMYSVNYGAIGSETCLSCPLGQWSPEGSPNCNLCPANSRAAAGSGLLTSCVCDAGYTGAAGSTCVSCAVGTYKETTGSASCSACPALASTSGTAVSLSDCWCVTGYVKVSGVCVTMVPRAVSVVGSLAGVAMNSSVSQIENATQALRASIASRLNISIDLVQIERLPNSVEVRVSIFGRTETELNIIEGQLGLATTVPTVLRLPFTLSTSVYTNVSVLAAPRAVVLAGRLNVSIGNATEALLSLRLGMSQQYNVSLSAVRLNFDVLSADNTLPITVTIDVGSEQEMQRVRIVSNHLAARGNLTIANSRTFKIDSAQDAGPCGLNFTSALVRTDGVPMTLAEVQSGSTLSQMKTQLSLYYGVPESAVELNVVQVDGVYSVQSVVRAVQPETVETLQKKFVQSSPSLNVSSVTLALPFKMTNMDVSYVSVPVVSAVGMPNAVSIQSELVYADGTALSSSEVAQAADTLILQMSRFYGVDTSLVQVEIIPPRNPAVSNASSVRVVILSGVQTVDDVFQRAEQMTATAEVRVVPVAIAGLNNAQTTVLQGQMVAGRFVECPANYRVYERDQNLARSCGASGSESCPTSCSTQMNPWTGIDYGPHNANDGVISQESNFVSGCYGSNGESLLCGNHYEWWQVDLSRQRDIKSMTMHITTLGDWFFEDFDIELSNDGITFVKCATNQNAEPQYLWGPIPKFVSTHACVGSARYFRISSFPRDHMFISEVQVYGETLPGTCQCAPGHMLQSDLSTCTACAAGKYSNETDSRVCTDCPADTYSNDARTACSGCPANSVSVTGSSTVLACTCIAGYFFFLAPEGRTCLPCAAGSYKNTAGNVNCSVCSLSNIENQVCCPADSTLMSSACFCNAGFSGAANGPCGACETGKYKNTTSTEPCVACAAGSFSNVNGSMVCALCPENTFSGAGAPSCSACPNLTQSASGSNSSMACQCVAGYTGSGGLQPCTPCVAGTYKTVAGSGVCTPCPARTFSGAVGAPSIAACMPCHPNATSAVGSPSQEYCYCEAGFAQVNGTDWCALCNPGKYNTQLARTACSNCTVGLYAAGYGSKGLDSCSSCPTGQWSPEGSPDCKMCPVNSAAPARSGSSTNCICNPGFTGPDGGPCLPCEAGKFKAVNGSGACTPCAFGSDSVSGQAACTCTERFYANGSACLPKYATLQGVFQCNVGYTGPNGTGPCVECAVGTYKNVLGSAACTSCPAGQNQSALAATSCSTCAADTFSNIGASACTQCPAGFQALPGTTTVQDCCGLNSRPQNITNCTSGLTNVIASYSTTACARFIALTPKPSFASISTRNNAAVGTVPTYNAAGGPNGKGHVSFDRTKSQYLDAGSRTFNIASNGGLTIVLVMRFTGSVSAWERVLELGNLGNFGTNSMLVARQSSGTSLLVDIFDGSVTRVLSVTTASLIVQNSWLTVVVQYSASNKGYSISVNGAVTNTGTIQTAISDRTLTHNWIARSNNGEAYLNADIAGAFVVDEFLSTAATTAISNAMIQGVDLTSVPCQGTAQSCSSGIGCSCNTGYTGLETGASKGQCTICPPGTYKPTNGSAACASCPVNANSSAGSTNVSACSCNPGYTGPDVGPCVACAAGTAKSVSGSAACSVCPANTYSASVASVCTACPAGFKTLPGTTTSADCCGLNSNPQSITTCTQPDPLGTLLATSPAYLMTSAEAWDAANSRFTDLSGNGRHGALTGGTVSVGTVTGNGAGFSIPFAAGTVQTSIMWPSGSIPSTFTVCSITRYTGGASTRILDANGGNWLHGHWGGNAGSTHYNGPGNLNYGISPNTNWVVVCGRNTGTAGATSTIVNDVPTSTASGGMGNVQLIINIGGEKSDWQLSRLYVWNRHLSNSEFAEASAKLNSYVAGVLTLNCVTSIRCSCNTGYTGPDTGASKGQCATCPPGTYKPTNGSATCTLCPENTYSTAVQASTNSTCLACPSNSVSVAGSTGCVCNFGYTGEMASCTACVPGKYKRVLGSSTCIDCPANTQALSAATTVCSSLAGFSGLGYALEDVARSCGSALNETCKTLSNGATSNAGGVTDGGLDGNVNTFVSVAFNPNLARSCGITGTAACAASNAPAFQGAPSLGNDGDINTATRTQYGTANLPYITPYWSVDFGQSRSVFAVKILMMIVYGNDGWAYLKDFKITVGDSPVWCGADGKTPLNTVCADYLTGAGRSYVTVTCEDTVRGRYLHVVGGPHVDNYVTISEIAVDAFNYTATPALMQPWWAVDFEVERAVGGVSIQTQTSSAVQVRVGHSTDPLQNAVCASGALAVGVNNTISCATAMTGRYLFVIGPGNSVLTLNEVRVIGIGAAPCSAGTYKPLVGNHNCTACPAFSTSVVGATGVQQCSCKAGYLDVWS